ncbi:hypothetical protein ACFL1M_03945 [Patescibacteria group bacterium]
MIKRIIIALFLIFGLFFSFSTEADAAYYCGCPAGTCCGDDNNPSTNNTSQSGACTSTPTYCDCYETICSTVEGVCSGGWSTVYDDCKWSGGVFCTDYDPGCTWSCDATLACNGTISGSSIYACDIDNGACECNTDDEFVDCGDSEWFDVGWDGVADGVGGCCSGGGSDPTPTPQPDDPDDPDPGDPTPTPTPINYYTVSGTVYEGSGSLSGGLCSGSGVPVEPGSSALVGISGYGSSDIAADGTYSISNVAEGTRVASTSLMDSQYLCDCPGGCAQSISVGGDMTVDFYLTTTQIGWFQTIGGDVGVNGGYVYNDIPATCSGLCLPYLSLLDLSATTDSSGVVTTSSAGGHYVDINFGEGSSYVALSEYRTTNRREGYEYFYRLFELGLAPTDDFVDAANVGYPSSGPSNGRAYYSDESIVINSDWDLLPGDSIVVFVDGDIRVQSQIITDVGEFVAFIASGDIIFDPSVGTTEAGLSGLVQGVFVANGQIIVEAAATKFVGEGTFVGWGGVDLSRDYGDATNNLYPAELFIYRPDFVTNAPARMKRPVIRWQEVAP